MPTTASAASAALATPAAAGAGLLQMMVGLVLVLALVGVSAWLLKRFALVPGAGSGPIRIIAGASVGQRERIVLVQVADTWVLLGVAPGRVNMLHSLLKSETPAPSDPMAPSPANFQAWLKRITEGRK